MSSLKTPSRDGRDIFRVAFGFDDTPGVYPFSGLWDRRHHQLDRWNGAPILYVNAETLGAIAAAYPEAGADYSLPRREYNGETLYRLDGFTPNADEANAKRLPRVAVNPEPNGRSFRVYVDGLHYGNVATLGWNTIRYQASGGGVPRVPWSGISLSEYAKLAA